MNKIIVMMKARVSYVKLSDYASSVPSYFLINGETAVIAPGDKRYAIVNGEVTRIERKVTPRRSIIGYKLADRYREVVTTLPHEMPVDSFSRDDDGYLCGDNAEFYVAVYDDPSPILEPIEFEVIDRDCEPVSIPSYVTIDFPNNIARYPETQHKYPCRISAETVFNLLWDRVKESVNESDGQYTMDSYKNIQTLTVSERIEIPYHQTRNVEYYPTLRAKKTKIRTETVTHRTVKLFDVCGPKYSNSSGSVPKIQPVKGENYADLQDKLEAYIQSFLSELTEGKRQVCAKCRGEGVVCV